MESNLVNFNYEYDLYKTPIPIWMERVLRPSMESLYFYCDETVPLASTLEYEKDFLAKVNGTVVPTNIDSKNWWGEHHPLAAKSNCKLQNHIANKSLGHWVPQGGIVSSWQELDDMMGEGRWRLKDPWMMGGTGQWRIDRELLHDPAYRRGIETRLLKGSMLLEQSLEIDDVLGTTFEITEHHVKLLFSVKNFLNSQGNFQGGELVSTPTEIESELKAMAQYWQKQGARGILEIDSFKLQNGWYPCVEINHRKTMGWFIWHLSKKMGPGKMLFGENGGVQINPTKAPLRIEWLTT